jgi:hypothetical protein
MVGMICQLTIQCFHEPEHARAIQAALDGKGEQTARLVAAAPSDGRSLRSR